MPRPLRRRRGARRQLERLLRRVQARSATTVPKRVLGRGADGVEIHLPLGGTCATRATIDSHAAGQITLQPVQSLSFRGVAGAGQGLDLFGGAARVDRQEPRTLLRGQVQEVSVFGRGFRVHQTWQYLLPPGETESEMPHPHLEILHTVPESDHEHRLLVSTSAEAELAASGPLAFDLTGRPPGPSDAPTNLAGRAEDIYAVGDAAAAFLAYWATFDGEAVWLAAELDAGGNVLRWLGELERDVDFDVDLQISHCAPILADSSGSVSPGALLQPYSDQLFCLDFAGGVRHEMQWPGDHVAGAAAWQDEVYAVVHTKPQAPRARIRLIRLSPNLSSEATIAELDLDPGDSPAIQVEWFDAVGVAISPISAWAAVEWADFGSQQFGYQTCLLPHSGEPRQGARPAGAAGGPSSLGLPYGPGGAVRGSQLWQGGLGLESGDEAWRQFTPQDWGAEGGPGLGDIVLTWDGSSARQMTVANADGVPFGVPPAEHPTLGPVGVPTLLFPAR